MADDADRSGQDIEILDDAAIREVQRRAAAMPKGTEGECRLCGEYFARLVNNTCARCRDLHKLP